MFNVTMKDLKAFLDCYVGHPVDYLEYNPIKGYEITINDKVVSSIYQDNKDIDAIEVFLNKDDISLPMTWESEVMADVFTVTKKSLTNSHFLKMVIAKVVGCNRYDIVDRKERLNDDNMFESRISKRGRDVKDYNTNLKNFMCGGVAIIFTEHNDRIEVEARRSFNVTYDLFKDLNNS